MIRVDGRGGSSSLIQVRGLNKTYSRGGEQIQVLQGLNLDVDKGDFVAFMGPSGSGKTTLLNLLGGLDVPSAGSITVDGDEITHMSASKLTHWRARHVGFIFQLYNLIPVLTAFQNVELPLLLTRLSGSDRKKRVHLALQLVGLDGRAGHLPRQLSGGEEQRVAIARAIVADATRLVVRHAASLVFPLPLAYKERLERVPGVERVSWGNWFGGYYQDPKNQFTQFAVDAVSLFDLFPELLLPGPERETFLGERTSCIAGKALVAK